MALSDTNLLCRYWLDEAASGTAITTANDVGPANYDLTSISYSTTLAWAEVGGNRGLSSSANSGQAVVKGPTFASNAAMVSGLNGKTKMTVELVVDLDAASVGGRLLTVAQNTSYGHQLGIYCEGAGAISYAWAGNVQSSIALSGRSVVHMVVDTTLASERMKVYVNNVKIVGTNYSVALNSALAVDTSYVLALFNRPNALGAAPKATVFYAAVYSDDAFDATRVADHYDVLTLDDDTPVTDTTAPTLSSATASATSGTTSSGSVTTDEANGTLYWLTNTSSTATVAAVKAGSSQTVTATGAQSTSSTGLSTGTTYYTHFVHTDVAANDSTVLSSASFTTPAPDTTAPTFTGSITVGAKTSSTIALTLPTATDNVAVTGYEYRVDAGAWVDNGNSTAVSITGLTALTSYTIDARAYDAAANASTTLSVTTSTYRAGASAGSIVTATGPTGGNPAGFLYDLAQTLPTSDWVSYYIVSGPTPSGGTLDAQVNGAFSYFGPEPATLVIQPEVNGVEDAQITVTLYDQSADTTAPTFTGSITVAARTTTTITLTMPTATDDTAVTGYEYRVDGGAWTDNGLSTTVALTGLTEDTSYTIDARAYDAEPNYSTTLSITASTLLVAPPEPDTGITQFAPFPTKAGKVQLSTASVSASDVYLNRLRYLTDGSAIRAVAASPDLFSSGMPMSYTGQVCYIDATAGLPAGTVWANGMPFSAGRLCVSTGTVASYQNGIPFAANGAVAVELI